MWPFPWENESLVQKTRDTCKIQLGNLIPCNDPEGWDGAGGGGGVQDGEHMYTHGRFMSMYGKNHYNIVK